jgi:hypothetical protein
MYCQEAMGTNGSANYWLDSCDLTGGSSGGPWLQPLEGGNGPVISVNSWGYTTRAGMAGPKLHDNSAQLLFGVAAYTDLGTADRGFVIDPNNPPGNTTTTTTTSTTSTTTTSTTTTSTTSTTVPTTGDIVLTVSNYTLRGAKVARLTWSGATGPGVDVYRDGAYAFTTPNDGYHVDWLGVTSANSNSWQVCEAGSNICSNEVTVGW